MFRYVSTDNVAIGYLQAAVLIRPARSSALGPDFAGLGLRRLAISDLILDHITHSPRLTRPGSLGAAGLIRPTRSSALGPAFAGLGLRHLAISDLVLDHHHTVVWTWIEGMNN